MLSVLEGCLTWSKSIGLPERDPREGKRVKSEYLFPSSLPELLPWAGCILTRHFTFSLWSCSSQISLLFSVPTYSLHSFISSDLRGSYSSATVSLGILHYPLKFPDTRGLWSMFHRTPDLLEMQIFRSYPRITRSKTLEWRLVVFLLTSLTGDSDILWNLKINVHSNWHTSLYFTLFCPIQPKPCGRFPILFSFAFRLVLCVPLSSTSTSITSPELFLFNFRNSSPVMFPHPTPQNPPALSFHTNLLA